MNTRTAQTVLTLIVAAAALVILPGCQSSKTSAAPPSGAAGGISADQVRPSTSSEELIRWQREQTRKLMRE